MRGAPRFRQDRRAAVALMVAIMSPAMLGVAALVVDTGFWVVGQTRLQMAADAAAMASSYLLTNSTVKAQSNYTATFQTVALAEAQSVAPRLVGTIQTPAISVAADWKSVSVTLTSPMPSYFFGIFGISAPTESATATATLKGAPVIPCVLTLGPTGIGIKADNSGAVTAANCPVFSNSSGTPSIYVDSGSITANGIGAVGTIGQSNSGSNSLNSGTSGLSPNSTAATDPEAQVTPPTAPSTCDATNANYGVYGQFRFTPHGTPAAFVFCGDTTIGGNGSTDTFDPGVYYVVNGSLTFNNVSVTSPPSGVSFVLTGSNPGSFSWTNYSNSSFPITAPTSGSTKGIALWQACNSAGGQSASFQGGSTLSISGTMYMPCASVDVGNNAQLNAALGMPLNLIAKSIYAHGSGTIRTAPDPNNVYGTATAAAPVLTQ